MKFSAQLCQGTIPFAAPGPWLPAEPSLQPPGVTGRGVVTPSPLIFGDKLEPLISSDSADLGTQ